MLQPQAPHPVRATWFYSLVLFLAGSLGWLLQSMLRMTGLVLTELLLFLGMAVYFAVVVDRQPLRRLFQVRMLRPSGWLKTIILGLVTWALANVAGSLIIDLVVRFGGRIPETHAMLARAPLLVSLLTGALLPAICEEAAFRGYLLWNLGPLGPTAAVLTTGILFGVMHLSFIRLIPLALLGIVFAAAVQRTGSILPGVVMHFLNNATSLVLTALQKSPDATPSLPSLGTVLLMIVILISLTASVWGLLTTFHAGDAVPDTAGQPAPVTPSPRVGRLALALLPALLLYAFYASSEVLYVFAGR